MVAHVVDLLDSLRVNRWVGVYSKKKVVLAASSFAPVFVNRFTRWSGSGGFLSLRGRRRTKMLFPYVGKKPKLSMSAFLSLGLIVLVVIYWLSLWRTPDRSYLLTPGAGISLTRYPTSTPFFHPTSTPFQKKP